jgi:hypothetical protein
MLDGMNVSEVSRALGQPVHAVNLKELMSLITERAR